MLTVELVRPQMSDVPELGRICFEAFRGIHQRHAFPLDLPSPEIAQKVIAMLVSRNDFFSVAACVDGRLVGSNFISLTDEVGGVGPITVDPEFDGRGIGRRLMEAVLEHAHQSGIKQVRLLQDAFNTRSLSLYASLGLTARAPIGLMNARAADNSDPSVRRAATADVPALDRLCRRVFKVDRRGEIEAALKFGFPFWLRDGGGRVTAYAIPGFFGHGAGETAADALAVVGETARHLAAEEATFFCPLTSGDFFRAALQAGHRLRKVMTYMTYGPYTPPEEIWMPSIGY